MTRLLFALCMDSLRTRVITLSIIHLTDSFNYYIFCLCQAVHFASGSLEDGCDDTLSIVIYLSEQNGRWNDGNTGKVKFQNLIEKYSAFQLVMCFHLPYIVAVQHVNRDAPKDVTLLKRRERSFKFYLWEAIKFHMVC